MSDRPANRHKSWVCPFFKWDGKKEIHGECGKITFPSRATADEYMTNYCADNPGWKKCPIADAIYHYYDDDRR